MKWVIASVSILAFSATAHAGMPWGIGHGSSCSNCESGYSSYDSGHPQDCGCETCASSYSDCGSSCGRPFGGLFSWHKRSSVWDAGCCDTAPCGPAPCAPACGPSHPCCLTKLFSGFGRHCGPAACAPACDPAPCRPAPCRSFGSFKLFSGLGGCCDPAPCGPSRPNCWLAAPCRQPLFKPCCRPAPRAVCGPANCGGCDPCCQPVTLKTYLHRSFARFKRHGCGQPGCYDAGCDGCDSTHSQPYEMYEQNYPSTERTYNESEPTYNELPAIDPPQFEPVPAESAVPVAPTGGLFRNFRGYN